MRITIAILVLLIFQGCAVIEPSDAKKRKILQEQAEKVVKEGWLFKKLKVEDICTEDQSRFRYICWRYYEVGGEIWRYRHSTSGRSSKGYILVKDGKGIARQKSARSFQWYSDKGREDLGYDIVKGK